ncbi:hypothetical protein [Streptomyces cylindrosporus]|uniref:hypothetical protein n=1 Tax=Streptomyces cylindrosporus TaxID=2927583 RepID=UPI00355666A9
MADGVPGGVPVRDSKLPDGHSAFCRVCRVDAVRWRRGGVGGQSVMSTQNSSVLYRMRSLK